MMLVVRAQRGHSGAVTNWRPDNPSEPDPEWTHAYQPLSEVAPKLTAELIDAYGRRWLDQAELPMARLPEMGDTLELMVRADDDGQALRLTSWYTGSTYWLYGW